MQRVIANSTSVAMTALFAALSRALGYARRRVWLQGGLLGLGSLAGYISHAGLWGNVLHYGGRMILLSLPIVLVAWLVVGAEDARQTFRPTRTCRRQ